MSTLKNTVIDCVDIYNRVLLSCSDIPQDYSFLVSVFIVAIMIASLCYFVYPQSDYRVVVGFSLFVSLCLIVKSMDAYDNSSLNIYHNPIQAGLYGCRYNARPISLKPLFQIGVTDNTILIPLTESVIIQVIDLLRRTTIEEYYTLS